VLSALARSSGLLLEDGEPGPGLPRLRELIAARFTDERLATSPQQILVTAGARAAMSLLVAHLRPRAAIVENPTFFGILSILRQSASRISSIAVSPQGWNPRHINDAFSGLNGGIAMLVPDFHNPTAAVMSRETWKEIAERARSAKVTIIANEVMRGVLDVRLGGCLADEWLLRFGTGGLVLDRRGPGSHADQPRSQFALTAGEHSAPGPGARIPPRRSQSAGRPCVM
jgi:hypothetical protein